MDHLVTGAFLAETDVPLFDVVVRMPSGLRLEDLQTRGLDAGVRPDRLEALVKALRNGPQVKIGAGVTGEKAESAKLLYGKVGLHVDVTPVLSLKVKKSGSFDGLTSCPACRERVTLTEERQCPQCGVFVDKFTEEYRQKRRQAELERAALRNELMRELEEEFKTKFKNPSVFAGKKGMARAACLAVLLCATFAGGRATLAGWSYDAVATGRSKGGSVNQMLDAAWPAGGSAAVAGAGTGAGAGAGSAPAAGLTGDPDLDDPLIQQAGGKRIGAKGLTIEQAVGAATLLAKSVGNSTAERAMGDAGAAAPGAQALEAAAAAAPAAQVAPATKKALALDFARALSEIGHHARARTLLSTLEAQVKNDAALRPLAQATSVELRAWSLKDGGNSRAAAESLLADAAAIADAGARTRALIAAGVVLSRQPQMPPEAARAFLTRAAEALKQVNGNASAELTNDWAVSLGTVLLNESLGHARSGQWASARAGAAQLAALAQQAPTASAQAQLVAMEAHLKAQLGQQAEAATRLAAALDLASRAATLPERSAALRGVSRFAGPAADARLAAAIAAVQHQALAQTGLDRAKALSQIALLQAEAGSRARAAEAAQAARSTLGLLPDELVQLNADLIIRGDLAAARAFHTSGQYAEAEAVLTRLGNYLL